MIALLLIPFGLIFLFNSLVDDEIEAIAEENGIDDFNPNAPSIYDEREFNVGSNEPDTLTGTSGDDAIFALGNTDLVRALDGDDLVDGGSNNDTVFGGAGNDIIGGNTGADLLYGDRGDDVLFGNEGDDLLIGRSGDDTLIGGGASDSLNGGPGDDLLISGHVALGSSGREIELSATAFTAAQQFSDDDLEDVDFNDLEARGALNGVSTDFLNEALQPTQGGDLRGAGGDDVLVLAGGDMASGGAGNDEFVLSEDMITQTTVQITDYRASEDMITLEYEGARAPEIDVRERGEDAVIFIGEAVIARVVGAAGELTESSVMLVRSD